MATRVMKTYDKRWSSVDSGRICYRSYPTQTSNLQRRCKRRDREPPACAPVAGSQPWSPSQSRHIKDASELRPSFERASRSSPTFCLALHGSLGPSAVGGVWVCFAGVHLGSGGVKGAKYLSQMQLEAYMGRLGVSGEEGSRYTVEDE